MEKMVERCPHCGDRTKERHWCANCGDITWLDEYIDDQLDRVRCEYKQDTKIRLPNEGTGRGQA